MGSAGASVSGSGGAVAAVISWAGVLGGSARAGPPETRFCARRVVLPRSLADAARRTPQQLSGMRLTCGYHRSVPAAPGLLRHPVQRRSRDDHNGAMRPCAWSRRQAQESRAARGRIGHRGFLERGMNPGANCSSSVGAPLDPGCAARFTTRPRAAQALASDASTAIIASTKASMTITLPAMTSQLPGPDMRFMAR